MINIDQNVFNWGDMAYTFIIAMCAGAGLAVGFAEIAWRRRKKKIERKLESKKILYLANKTSVDLKETLKLCRKELEKNANNRKEPKN